MPGVGIDLKKYQTISVDVNVLRKSLGLKEDDFVLLSVGELSKRKNQEVLIRALAKIPDENVKYVIAGMGELEKAYHSLIKELHLQNRVILVGYRDDYAKKIGKKPIAFIMTADGFQEMKLKVWSI
ncbi:MAG: glycosyltransferase [Ruminococcus flavefaciens]|nr:glycosyltransferase [Ruminococcus flavefaciens]